MDCNLLIYALAIRKRILIHKKFLMPSFTFLSTTFCLAMNDHY